MIRNANHFISTHDVSCIETAVEKKLERFKRELEDAVNDWIRGVNPNSLDYVGSRIGGPEPKPVSIQNQIDRIISSIEAWGDE